LIAILSGIFLTIVGIFWYKEMQYLMPTPVPADYKVVRPEELIQYDSVLLPQQHKSRSCFISLIRIVRAPGSTSNIFMRSTKSIATRSISMWLSRVMTRLSQRRN
jgi:hypothetical protein